MMTWCIKTLWFRYITKGVNSSRKILGDFHFEASSKKTLGGFRRLLPFWGKLLLPGKTSSRLSALSTSPPICLLDVLHTINETFEVIVYYLDHIGESSFPSALCPLCAGSLPDFCWLFAFVCSLGFVFTCVLICVVLSKDVFPSLIFIYFTWIFFVRGGMWTWNWYSVSNGPSGPLDL